MSKQQKEEKKLVRFDWAIKRLLRHKADHTILEGFLTSLLGRPIKIEEILESESNQQYEENKQNRVDIIAKESDGSTILIEVQNETEDSYFHRMLFATSRTISEYLRRGESYDRITKIYSVNIVYFNLGEGSDYVYKGTTSFRGLHNDEELRIPRHLKVKYGVEGISDLFPEYYILKVNDFNRWSETPLDQWMYFLANSCIPAGANAPGLKEADDELQISRLDHKEQEAYYKYVRDMNELKHLVTDAWDKGVYEGRVQGIAEGMAQGIEKGKAEEKIVIARKLRSYGMDDSSISEATGLTLEELRNL